MEGDSRISGQQRTGLDRIGQDSGLDRSDRLDQVRTEMEQEAKAKAKDKDERIMDQFMVHGQRD